MKVKVFSVKVYIEDQSLIFVADTSLVIPGFGFNDQVINFLVIVHVELQEEWLLGDAKNIALQLSDGKSFMDADHFFFDLFLLAILFHLMDFDVVSDVSLAGFNVLLLHFSDGNVVDGHEGNLVIVGLLLGDKIVDQLSSSVEELDDPLGFIDIVSLQEY